MSELPGATLYLDCFSGIAGDMALGALLDLGVPEAVVRDALGALELPEVTFAVTTVLRGGLAGRKVDVRHAGRPAGAAHGPVAGAPGPGHHAYAPLRARLVARLAPDVAAWALAIFDAVAEVEARRHGVAVDAVVLHELGAADSVVDVVGCAAALAWLRPAAVHCRPVPLGGGRVLTAHGHLPVPAPATLELLRGAQIDAGGRDGGALGELTTPTGAAVIRAAVLAPAGRAPGRFGPLPSGRVLAIGWGAGTRELRDRPNLLRVVALQAAGDAVGDAVEVLEANLDDLPPVLAAPLLEALLDAGALDAWFTPIVMKKGRPALTVSAIAPPARREAIEAVLFRESTTLGVRRSRWDRTVLDREVVAVATSLGPVEVKVAGRRDPSTGAWLEIHSMTPELEACRRIAAERRLPLRRVYELAAAAATRENLIS